MRVLLVLLLVARAAAADPSADREHAAATFSAAERAFGEEDYPEALRLFRLAFEAAPDDSVRFNIAVCLERLGRFREAGVEYDGAATSQSLPDDVRERARAEAKRVRARLGKLDIEGDPVGAAIRIDGTQLCSLPCTIDVDPGRHELVAEAHGVADRRVVTIERGLSVRIALHASLVYERRGAGWLTWVGLSAAAIGGAGTAVFGLRARELHDEYLMDPTAETRNAGMLARNLSNGSLALGITGVAFASIDLFVLARRTHAHPRREFQ